MYRQPDAGIRDVGSDVASGSAGLAGRGASDNVPRRSAAESPWVIWAFASGPESEFMNSAYTRTPYCASDPEAPFGTQCHRWPGVIRGYGSDRTVLWAAARTRKAIHLRELAEPLLGDKQQSGGGEHQPPQDRHRGLGPNQIDGKPCREHAKGHQTEVHH